MPRYVISDLHLGHENIIRYCERPFDDVEQMNQTIIENWNERVSDDDQVLFLGDLSHNSEGMTPDAWLQHLNGDILFVRGNHDSGVSQNAPVNVVENCAITHGRYRFYCQHRPPENTLSGWTLHGHVHNNEPLVHPFIHPSRQTVNVSCELLDYKPILLDTLVRLLDEKQRYRDITETDVVT